MSGTNTWTHTNAWAGGRIIATWDSSGIHFPLTDPLGTKRIQTNYLGNPDEFCVTLPFGNPPGGGTQSCTGDAATEHLFTGKERDAESGNDYFGARYYSSTMGHFLSPDPKIMTARHLTNPQKWNKYAYVIDDPLMRLNPDGMDDYVVFRTVTSGTDTAAWAAAEKSITSQKDSKGRLNTFHIVEGDAANGIGRIEKHWALPTHTSFLSGTQPKRS